MKELLVNPQTMCKNIDKAIKIDKDFMFKMDAKVASMSIVLPASEMTNKKTKWGKISSCARIYKELKTLKKATVKFKISEKNNSRSKVDELEFQLACTNFALKFDEIVKGIILNKIVVPKDERSFWDELLELFDMMGLQLANDYELFASLGRVELAINKMKEKKNQEELNRLNFQNQQKQEERML